jgi:hypothetical protein
VRDRAVITVKAATVVGVMDASAPPASTTSQPPVGHHPRAGRHRVGPGGAGGGERLRRTLEAVAQGHGRSPGVRHHHRDGERRHPAGSALGQYADLRLQRADAADARAELDAHPGRVDLQRSGVVQRHLPCGHRELGEAIEVPRLLAGQPRRRVEVLHGPFAPVDRSRAQPLPERLQAGAGRGHDAHPGDDHPPRVGCAAH